MVGVETRTRSGAAFSGVQFVSYRALLRDEVGRLLTDNVRWLLPEVSGFYQPIILADAQSQAGGADSIRSLRDPARH